MDVSGKSGFPDAWGSTATGPRSDHSKGGFTPWRLKRRNVVMPIPGFTRTSSISTGRTTTVSFWAYPDIAAAKASRTHQVACRVIDPLRLRPVNQLRPGAIELHSGCKPYAKFP